MNQELTTIKTGDKTSIKGEYTFVNVNQNKIKDKKMRDIVLPRLRIALRNKDKTELDKMMKEGIITDITEKTNLVPTTGKNVIARLLAGDTTYTGIINYGAFGSGSTPFSASSTQLNTEVFRKLVTTSSFSDNQAIIDWFIEADDIADQTFEEFGAFIDGTASANTGKAFSLLITGGWVKSGSTFISATYTII